MVAVLFLLGAGKVISAKTEGKYQMNILLLYLWLIPLILLHEFGHALASKMVGFKLLWMSIGTGRQLFDKRILGLRMRIHLIPLSGLTAAVPQSTSGLRWRLWWFAFAGPAVHVFLILLCYFLLGFDFFRTLLFPLSIFSRTAPVEMFIYANLILLVSSLFPKYAGGSGGQVHSDGYQLVKIPFYTQEELEKYKMLDIGMEALEQIEAGNLDKGIAIYESGLKIDPQNYMLRHDLAFARIKQGRFEEARTEYIDLLDSKGGKQPDHRVLLLNNIAWADVLLRKDELLVEADRYSEEAILKEPKNTNYRGTRGAVLIRTGRIEEGLKMLRKAFDQHSDKSARASVACWIAIGEARVGNLDESNKWLQKAREEWPSHYLLGMTEQEIQPVMS